MDTSCTALIDCVPRLLGHKANYAGWRANCELVPYDHPLLGSVQAVRVLGEGGASSSSSLPAGTELTLDYSHMIGLQAATLRKLPWLASLLDTRTEEGYYTTFTLHTAVDHPYY